MKKKRINIVERAITEIQGFEQLYKRFEQKVVLGGLSESTLANYIRCVAHIALHFKCLPTDLNEEQINAYLFDLKAGKQPSLSYFKHTICGLRFLFKLYELPNKAIKLPTLKKVNKLPVVLSTQECKRLFSSGSTLKHRVLLSLIYSCGLRLKETRNLLLSDIDFDRMEVHIRQTKYYKSRYVPLSPRMVVGLKKYYKVDKPVHWVFNGRNKKCPFSACGMQWAIRKALKVAGIIKKASMHTLRHSYATHLLEAGMDIDTLRKLLGHSHIMTTMIYVHVARMKPSNRFSPFDTLYSKDES